MPPQHARLQRESPRRLVRGTEQQRRNEIPPDLVKRVEDVRWSKAPEENDQKRGAAKEQHDPEHERASRVLPRVSSKTATAPGTSDWRAAPPGGACTR